MSAPAALSPCAACSTPGCRSPARPIHSAPNRNRSTPSSASGAPSPAGPTSGELLAPEEAVTALEALQTYTTGAAYADFAEERVGTLEPGKLADLIVCGRDPLTVPTADLEAFRPVATLLGGRVVAGQLAVDDVLVPAPGRAPAN